MTEPLDLAANYTGGDYVYKMGGNGSTVVNGKKQIDCSHMVNLLLTGAGYSIPYEDTRVMENSTYYTTVLPQDVKRGDIALWINATPNGPGAPLFHTGIVQEFNAANLSGYIFGAQTSTGPARARFGPKPPSFFWPVATKFLRAKEEFRTGAADAAPAAPAATPAPAGPAPLMNFQYPFRKADGKQFTDAEEVYKALEGETSGHYLLGSNRFWHGGIHISDQSAPQCVLNEPIRCMADGEVVAYRLNEDYLESTFGDNEKKLKYSNSFCLVRHEYKSQPNPETGPNKDKQNKLTFYSLYMHLLPYKRYPLAPDETPTPKVTMTVGDFKAYDTAPAPGVASESCGKLAKGTKLEILETALNGDVTYAKGKILSGGVNQGSVKKRSEGAEVWFAYLKNGEPYKNSKPTQIWVADKIPERARPNYWQGKVKAQILKKLDMYGDPAVAENGKPVGASLALSQLNPGGVIEFDSKEVLNLNVGGVTRRMAKCTNVSAVLAGAGTIPPSFWVCVESAADYHMLDWTSLTPGSFDSVQAASTGIKAGDPIGYLGQTENLTGEDGGVSSKYQVHVEIFTAEAEVKDFLKNTAGLKKGKQYVHLPVGTALKKKAPATETTTVQKQHAVDLSKAPVIKEGTEDWYEVSVTEDGQSITGLVKKAGAVIITQHDWEKLGFQIVEENNATADGFLDPEDMPPFFKDLFAKVDTNHDGNVSPGELAEALKNTDTRDQWAKLIAHHPTEWKYKADAAKWSKLDKLLETSPKTLKHEKERISKYVFWEELTGKASVSTDVVWHFHPIEFLNGLKSALNELITYEQMERMFPESANDKREEVRLLFNKYADRFSINTVPKISQFFAQVKTEVGDALVGKEESLWYSSDALKSNFGRYFNTYPAEADLYGYKAISLAQYKALSPSAKSAYTVRGKKAYTQLPNEEEIAKRIYCCCSAQGNFVLTPGGCAEGIKYKGKGFIQLTWKSNYKAVEDVLRGKLPEETINMVDEPNQLLETKIGLLSAMGFWELNKINNLVAATTESTNKITEVVNKHTDSYEERRKNFTEIYKAIGGSNE
ncbi:hypothetical protein [Pseudomonas viridiflava]|uniref:hypothetical protein n=1 Tax=Pseudomonas viridiflava TaxID=33069 RepID=UPI001F1313AE|nr:hypothetical protein [Pseudomonas viridiflava]